MFALAESSIVPTVVPTASNAGDDSIHLEPLAAQTISTAAAASSQVLAATLARLDISGWLITQPHLADGLTPKTNALGASALAREPPRPSLPSLQPA